jgi:hypothetical protein
MRDTRSQQQQDDAATDQQQVTKVQQQAGADHMSRADQDRATYIEARRNGVPCRMIALRLGWSKRRAERVRQRINRERKLETHTPPEHVIGCTRFGAMTPETLWFPQLAADSQSACLQTPNIGPTIESMAQNLAQTIADANRRLDELIAESKEGDKLIRDLEVASAKAETLATVEKEEAYIANRAENEGILRTAAVAAKKLSEARSRVAIVDGAIQRQKTFIAETQAAALANRDAEFLAEASKLRLREKLVKQATEFSELVLEIGCISSKHGGVNGFGLLHPLPPWSYPTNPTTTYIEALYQLVNAAYRFQSVQWTLTYDKTPWEKAA